MPACLILLLFLSTGTPNPDVELKKAIEKGEQSEAIRFVEAGADPNRRISGETYLVLAVQRFDMKLVQALLDHGALKGAIPGNHAVISALDSGRYGLAIELIEQGVSAHVLTEDLWTPLGVAVQDKANAVLRHLIKPGAPLDQQLVDGNSALHLAVVEENTVAAYLLLAAGANPKLANNKGFTPVDLVEQTGNKVLDRLFKEAFYQFPTDLAQAAFDGDFGGMVKLVKAGADINEARKDGASALMGAALNGDVEAIRYLLASGANIHLTDKFGQNALMYAAGNGRLLAVEALIDAGAHLDRKDIVGYTALGQALMKRDIPMIRLLTDQGARVYYGARRRETRGNFYKFGTRTMDWWIEIAPYLDVAEGEIRAPVLEEHPFSPEMKKLTHPIVVELAINRKGRVKFARIIDPPMQSRPIRKTLTSWRFTPAYRGRTPINYLLTLEIKPAELTKP